MMTGIDILYYIICSIVIIGTLSGIAMMSRVKTAVLGNKIGAVSIFTAIILTMWYNDILFNVPIIIVMIIGLIISVIWSAKIKMIAMPQVVALLNGFGGAASAIVGGVFLFNQYDYSNYQVFRSFWMPGEFDYPLGNQPELFTNITSAIAIAVGMITLLGSLVAVGKLSGKLNQKPVILPCHQLITTIFLILSFALVAVIAWGGLDLWLSLTLIFIISSLFGIIFTIRIGGADMPITISLLNSMTGIALAAAGMSVGDPMLISVGGIVGAAGLLLTQIMCRGMNRSLLDILMGKTTVSSQAASSSIDRSSGIIKAGKANYISILKNAKKVVIIPGYGMALSGAQGALKELSVILEDNGADVDFTIHPVAGRTAGHMNVLLADADIPYEKLREAPDIYPELSKYDVAVIVGANDIVNPAARSAKDTSLYGLPVFAVDEAKHIIICNLDRKPGYAGVDNPLYESDNVTLLLGDAAESVRELIDELSDKNQSDDVSGEAEHAGKFLADAKKVIIIPGYGMALAQAQGMVKELSDKLIKKGTQVDFAIHPVAGRMPGHMNVLLAEVDVSYEKLREMHDINPEFNECDVALIVGANDVVNPAARDAEGTPIYGMPILSADEAKHVIICNYDTKPGYAGVENPLYRSNKATLLLGDAAKTLKELIGNIDKAIIK